MPLFPDASFLFFQPLSFPPWSHLFTPVFAEIPVRSISGSRFLAYTSSRFSFQMLRCVGGWEAGRDSTLGGTGASRRRLEVWLNFTARLPHRMGNVTSSIAALVCLQRTIPCVSQAARAQLQTFCCSPATNAGAFGCFRRELPFWFTKS